MTDIEFVCLMLALPAAFVIDPLAPVVVFAWSLRLGLIKDPYFLQPAFQGFATDGFLLIASVGYVLHVLADKVPVLAHVMDAVGILLKPLALAFVGFWLSDHLNPNAAIHWITMAVILLGGVPLTFGLQALRTKIRLGASIGTLGMAHPAISTAESIAGGILGYLAVFHPVAALAVIIIVGVPVVWLSFVAVRAAGRATRRGLSAVINAISKSTNPTSSRGSSDRRINTP